MKRTSIIIMLACTLYLGCKRNECEEYCALPPITAEGKNTFGCKVNGELFFADAPVGSRLFNFTRFACNDTGAPIRTKKALLVALSNKAGGTLLFYLDDLIPFESATKQLNRTTDPWPAEVCAEDYARYVAGGKAYQTNESFRGEVTLSRFDTLNRIVSGTFHFTAVHPPTGESVSVTDGRFDINLSTFNK